MNLGHFKDPSRLTFSLFQSHGTVLSSSTCASPVWVPGGDIVVARPFPFCWTLTDFFPSSEATSYISTSQTC